MRSTDDAGDIVGDIIVDVIERLDVTITCIVLLMIGVNLSLGSKIIMVLTKPFEREKPGNSSYIPAKNYCYDGWYRKASSNDS